MDANPYRLPDGRLNPNFDHARHNREDAARQLAAARANGFATAEEHERAMAEIGDALNRACDTRII